MNPPVSTINMQDGVAVPQEYHAMQPPWLQRKCTPVEVQAKSAS